MHLVSINLKTSNMYRWARDISINKADDGYIVHSLLCAAYGNLRPHPFSIQGEASNGNLRILAYSDVTSEELSAQRSSVAEPEVDACFGAELSKELPETWEEGKTYRFETRITPSRRKAQTGKLVDAYMASDHGLDRSAVYAQWLSERMEKAAQISSVELKKFSLSPIHRRGNKNGERKLLGKFVVPDATMTGLITVKDGEAFKEMLRHGIGKQKAFGFGAVLIRGL